jgi:hypothetical protein
MQHNYGSRLLPGQQRRSRKIFIRVWISCPASSLIRPMPPRLHVEIGDGKGVRLDETAARLDEITHQGIRVENVSAAASAWLIFTRNRSGEPLFIDNTTYPENRRLALARSAKTYVHGFGLDLDLVGKGNNGHYAAFAWAA